MSFEKLKQTVLSAANKGMIIPPEVLYAYNKAAASTILSDKKYTRTPREQALAAGKTATYARTHPNDASFYPFMVDLCKQLFGI
jgi:hypothetical protein